jgi:hypothetical protein
MQARNYLQEKGVLYPTAHFRPECHHLLVTLFVPHDRIPPSIKNYYGNDPARAKEAAEKNWELIIKEIKEKSPRKLILSSEYYYTQEDFLDNFLKRLSSISDDVQPVVYFREPASHYVSMMQQDVKQARPLTLPDRGMDRRCVPLVEAAAGRPIVALNADRDALISGDIVKDFSTRFLGEEVEVADVKTMQLNESVSAEVMSILDRFRRIWSVSRPEVRGEIYILHRLLAKAEERLGTFRRPRIRDDAAAALRRMSGDARWLRERYGVVFSAVDYDAIDDAPGPWSPDALRVEDFVEVDPDIRDALLAEIARDGVQVERWRGRLRKIPGARLLVRDRPGVLGR